MIIKKELIKRDIAGDTILVPVGKTMYDAGGLFVLNELGSFIWDILPQAEDEQAILRAVLEEYEVSEEEAARDIDEFLGEMEKLGLIDR